MIRHAVSIACILLVLVVFAVPSASASSTRAEAKIEWHITGPKILFSKKETQKIAVGSGAAATFAAALPPPFDLIITSLSGGIAAMAGFAAIDGNCVGVKILPPLPFMPPAYPFIYKPSHKGSGRYCR